MSPIEGQPGLENQLQKGECPFAAQLGLGVRAPTRQVENLHKGLSEPKQGGEGIHMRGNSAAEGQRRYLVTYRSTGQISK